MHSLFLSCGLLSRWSRYHPASVPGRMDVSIWSGCGGGGGECLWSCWQSNCPKARQSHPVQVNVLPIPAQFSPVRMVHSRKCVWMYLRAELLRVRNQGESQSPPTSLLPLCWYTLDSNQYTHIHTDKKVTVHSTPTRLLWRQNHFQNVTWLLNGSLSNGSSPARSIWGEQPLSVCLNSGWTCLTLFHWTAICLYESLNFENWEYLSIAMREKPTFTFCVGKSLEWKSRKTFQAEVCSGQN